jgi:formylglycine-generating enzyme
MLRIKQPTFATLPCHAGKGVEACGGPEFCDAWRSSESCLEVACRASAWDSSWQSLHQESRSEISESTAARRPWLLARSLSHWKHRVLPTSLLALITLFALSTSSASSLETSALIPSGSFESVLPATEDTKQVKVAGFRLDRAPVTNAQFARFVSSAPEWRRARIARLFADEQYLQHWTSDMTPAAKDANKPVVHVSWFAASAYCEARGARLPTWHEWEYVAAASATDRDARDDAQWRQEILNWYSQSGRAELPAAGRTPANIYGIRDLHGAVWEWIEDLPSMLVANDSREQGDPNEMRFCGAGAITMEQKENYAMLMRIAMLSSMKASYTSATMGFRCALDEEHSQ